MSLDQTGRIGLLAVACISAVTIAAALGTAWAHGPRGRGEDRHADADHDDDHDADHDDDRDEADHDDDDASPAGLPAAEAADRLLAKVRYIRSDYPRAVVNGRIADAHEYDEQREVLEDALALTVPLPLSTGTRTAIGAIDAAVERAAPAEEVVSACDGLLARLGDELWLEIDPPDPARLAEGSTLYGANCAACHGAHGEGPAPEMALKPAPLAFRDAAVAAQLSPRRVYEAVTFGIDETAMVSKADVLSEPERWAVAFYVAGLAAPRGAGDVPAMTLEELADSTNATLAKAAPHGVAPAAAVGEYRGAEVGEAAKSPWLAMRRDARAAAARNENGAAALARLRARWKSERKPVAKVDVLLAMQVDTALSAMGTARHSEARAREAARVLEVSLVDVEKRMR